MINDQISIKGALTITKNGEVVREIDNLMVDTGKTLVASRIGSNIDNFVDYMGLGTGSTAAAAGDTALVAEVNRSPAASSTSVSNPLDVVFTSTFSAGVGSGSITEAGLFNAASSGLLVARTVFAVVNKGPDDIITITWTVTIS